MLYTVSEISTALDVAERTLRDWLRAGAPHTRDSGGHIWINGRQFADWITKMTEISTKPMQGKLILIRGICPDCGCKINRGGRIPTYKSNLMTWKDNNNAE